VVVLKIIKRKRLLDIILLIVIILLTTSLIIKFTYENEEEMIRGGLKGQIAFGIYNKGKILDSGSSIDSDMANHTLNISHNLYHERKYKIIVLVDFEQVEFLVDNKKVYSYDVDMEAVDEVEVDINVDYSKDAKELCYLIIKKPEYFTDERDIRELSSLKELMCLRYNLNENPKHIIYEKNLDSIDGKPLDEIFLTDKEEELKVITASNSNEEKKLVLGNLREHEIDYAVVQFVNWEQVPFQNGNRVNYFELMPDGNISYSVNIPEANKDSIVQYVAFSYPYTISENGLYSLVMGTFRVTVL